MRTLQTKALAAVNPFWNGVFHKYQKLGWLSTRESHVITLVFLRTNLLLHLSCLCYLVHYQQNHH